MGGLRDFWLRAAAGVSLLVPAYFLFAAFGTKYGLFDWRVGFGMLTLAWGPIIVIVSLIAATLALLGALIVPPRRGWRMALLSVAIPAVALLGLLGMKAQAEKVPPIHDVSTDLIDPPNFSSSVAAERALIPGSNGLDLLDARVPVLGRFGAAEGQRVVDVQRQAFPDIQPIPVGAPPAQALAAARGAAQSLGWTIDRVDEQAGVIEARETSFWYGFTDDIIVRITPADPGSVVDMRSVSRVGVSDLGANAKRVRAFRDELAKELTPTS